MVENDGTNYVLLFYMVTTFQTQFHYIRHPCMRFFSDFSPSWWLVGEVVQSRFDLIQTLEYHDYISVYFWIKFPNDNLGFISEREVQNVDVRMCKCVVVNACIEDFLIEAETC